MKTPCLVVFPLVVLLMAGAFMGSQALAVTKIAPTEAEPGHPFTIIDTTDHRLVDGSVPVFRLSGIEIILPLRTHTPYNTAQSRLVSNMYGGVYTVSLRQPDGTEFEIGPFTVLGPGAPPPFIEPDLGPSGTFFTITDYLARIQSGDIAVFYAEGTDPNTQGAVALSITISPDGTSLTGYVPYNAAQGVQDFVSVRPLGGSSRFGDLAFFVTGQQLPTINPSTGYVGTPFTITVPLGTMQQGDLCLFYLSGTDPATGTLVNDAAISSDGGTLSGTVPLTLMPGTYYVTVRDQAWAADFNDLPFEVTL